MQILKNNPQSKADFLHFNHILIVCFQIHCAGGKITKILS